MRILFFPLIIAVALFSPMAKSQTVGEFSLFLFEEGYPVGDAVVSLGDNIVQLTNNSGNAHIFVPSGIYYVEVEYRGEIITSFELLSIAGEDTQAIISVPKRGAQPDIDVETSNTDETDSLGNTQKVQEDLGNGKLSGLVLSVENKAPLADAQIYISGTQADIVTDETGTFEVELPVGVYSLSVILTGYAAMTIDGVEINKDALTEKSIELTPAGLELSEFVVLAPYIEGSVSSIVQETRDSSEVKEVLGAEQMSQAGDSNAASALARVTGLTIEDEKYVLIRGQPSRYTLSLLNGSPLPSPDPIRRVVPLDLFPTGVLASIDVQKSFSADKPGSFGGGLVNLSMRSIPEENFAEVSIGAAYNTQSTFKQGLTYQGGSTDFLGLDDGTRAIPQEIVVATQGGTINLDQVSDAERNELGKTFDNNYKVREETILPDMSGSITAGARFDTKYGEYGILGDFSWGQKFSLREGSSVVIGTDGDTLIAESSFEVIRTKMNAGVSSLIVAGGKWDDHEVVSNTFFIRDTDKITEFKEGLNNTSDSRYERKYKLDWNQREMFVQQFVGKHDFKNVLVDWRALTAESNREVLDRRTYLYFRLPDGSFNYYEEESAKREFNSVNDSVDSLAIDFTIPLVDKESFTSSIKIGAATDKQDRISDTARFSLEPFGAGLDLSQNPNLVLHPNNIGTVVAFSDDTQENDDYTGESTVTGKYVMADMKFTDLLRLNLGFRMEDADFKVKTFSRSSDEEGDEPAKGFTGSEILPGATATWFMNDEMQVRVGYSKTVSYPVLVELSETFYSDPDSGDTYLGNPDLKPATISGLDARWEWYFSTEELISIGIFQRSYENPIENGFFPTGGGAPRLTIKNAKSAVVNGVEVSGRFSLENFHENMYVQSNVTLMESSVDLGKDAGIATNTSRPLQGQANYVFNLQFGYDGDKHDWTLTFNQVGKRLSKANVQGRPDIYRQPLPELNSKWSWKINDVFKLSVAAKNILDPEYAFLGNGFKDKSYRKGMTIKSSLTAEF